MDKSKLPKMTRRSVPIPDVSEYKDYLKRKRKTKAGAVDDDAKGRMTRNVAKRKRILDQLK